MIFDRKLITSKIELLKYRDDIAVLFQESFGIELDKDLWKWAYIDNICGDPVVSLYFHKNKLIGHYAVVPMKLELNSRSILAALSMTTMVSVSYRRHGVFIKQANEVYEKAKEIGFSLVYGFPNKNSAPGFKKRLNWQIDSQVSVIKIRGKELESKKTNLKNILFFNAQDNELLEWRLSKPNTNYIRTGDLILKKFGSGSDIVVHNYDFSKLEEEGYYHILIDELDPCQGESLFDYVFGYKIFDNKLVDFNFKKDLVLSDIF